MSEMSEMIPIKKGVTFCTSLNMGGILGIIYGNVRHVIAGHISCRIHCIGLYK